MGRVLIVAFDGLDHRLIQDYDCTNLTGMSEFGTFDNHTGTSRIATSELFASFITGTTHQVHGVEGLRYWTRPVRGRFIDTVTPRILRRHVPGFQRLKDVLKAVLDAEERKYRREQLQVPSLFETVDDSVALAVPGYNPSWLWSYGAGVGIMNIGAGPEDVEVNWEKEYRWRKRELFRELKQGRRLVMAHFHKPDIYQHLYAYDDEVRREGKIRSLYREMDELAEQVRVTGEEHGFDTVLFMSDHGLPTRDAHNRRAFYSCNHALFPDTDVPRITDFHDRILELATQGSERSDEEQSPRQVGGLDI